MFRFSVFIIVLISILTSCNAFKPKKVDTREVSTNAQERARKNVNEGRGVSIDSLLGKVGGDTNFELVLLIQCGERH